MNNSSLRINSEDIKIHLNSAITDLVELVNLTETKYSYIYDCLPDVEREVDFSIREVEILLSHLLYNLRASTDDEQSVVIKILKLLMVELEKAANSFISQEQIVLLTGIFLNNSNSDGKNFNELARLVGQVHEALAVLRDLALNSIIFSVRIGEQGLAFQVLSDRINMVSLELRNCFDNMKNSIDLLQEWNDAFRNNLAEFLTHEHTLKNRYQNKIRIEFETVIATLKAVCSTLENNLENTKDAFGGIGEMMVGIQNQDLIRQNAENLIKCLKVMNKKRDILREESVERSLDYLVFANRVLQVSEFLLDNIDTSLNESITELGEQLSVMHGKASDLEDDTRYLAGFFAGEVEGKESGNVLSEVFDFVMGQVDELAGIKDQIESRGDSLLDGYETFTGMLGQLERDFEVINKEAKSLKKMKILIPIELARINLEGEFAIDDFTCAVNEVITTVDKNQQVFLSLRRFLTKNINELKTALDLTRVRLTTSAVAITELKIKLDTVRRLALGAVQASGLEMAQIFNQLKLPYQHLSDRDSIAALIADIRLKLNNLHKLTQELQEALLKAHGISHWEEKEDDLKVLMEQFTCFIERKVLTSVTGSEKWEIGTEGGNVVLF